ncbi:anhydro-N-acetylmuramic acid kinase [Chthonobacter albigriseus]|uniref:anhydro-N-acetylmuramic acid kinase n=1 Tax=Chthonobacter albigriseus TaxID=1683161 RepID=UPI001FCE81F6|nr:anhydro-N-acetylmuramic acid kinase [Chthonobacter albigriseus]
MPGGEMRWALGLMSGTSMDGVDAALIRTDGEGIEAFGPVLFLPYTDAERAVLRQALADAVGITDRTERPGAVDEAERIITDRHVEAVRSLAERAAADDINVDVVGFHGQTVFHAPDRKLTVQIGDAAALARLSGFPVVHDFRAADVAAGGQGAPLVPVFHRALAAKAGLGLPAAILNIGGVANVTIIGRDGSLCAFDTGPGNALIDDLVREKTGARFDRDGAFAALGTVEEKLVAELVSSPYFSDNPPKSLDRNAFSSNAVRGLPFEDAVATLTAFTAEAVAIGLRHTDEPIGSIVVAGGGAHNATLLQMIGSRTNAAVLPAHEIGLDGDFLEAQAFGYLAVRRLRGLPGSYPGTTGVQEPVVAGEVVGAEGRG